MIKRETPSWTNWGPSKGGKKFPKKRMDTHHAMATLVSASSEPVAGLSNATPMTSYTSTPSDVAQLHCAATVNCRCVGRANSLVLENSAVMSQTHRVRPRTLTPMSCHRQLSVSGSDCGSPAEQSAAATDPGADTLTGFENFYSCFRHTGPIVLHVCNQ